MVTKPPEPAIGMKPLGRLLRVNQVTLRSWHRNGRLTHVDMEYSYGQLNHWLKDGARNFAQPPDIQDLVDGRLTLLRPSEAMELLGLAKIQQLHHRLNTGAIAVVSLYGEHRYSRQSIEEFMARQAEHTPRLRRRQVAWIFGISPRSVDRLVAKGRLTSATRMGDRTEHPVSVDSVIELAHSLLPGWIDPVVWVRARLTSPHPLLALPRAAQVAGVSQAQFNTMMQSGRHVLSICLPVAPYSTVIMPESVAELVRRSPVLSREELAAQFGTTPNTVRLWFNLSSRPLACPVPDHLHTSLEYRELHRACMIGILDTVLSPGLSAITWYQTRLNPHNELFDLTAASQYLGYVPRHVAALARRGRLKGLNFRGNWRFTRTQLVRYQSRHPEVKGE